MMSDQTDALRDVYEVFAQTDAMSPPVHVFSVNAASPEMALAMAEENFFRREHALSIWVVRQSDVHKLSFADRDGYRKLDKPYRTTEDYKYLRDKWRHYREHPMDKEGRIPDGD